MLVPKFLITHLYVGLKTLDTLLNIEWLVQTSSVQTFEPIILIHRRQNFVSH